MLSTQCDAYEKLKSMKKLFITAAEAAPILECNPNDIRGQAQKRPDMLGFPVVVYGTRIKIPRIPFIQFIEQLPCCCLKHKGEATKGWGCD